MPHITIEYSANVETIHDIERLVNVVHTAALETGVPTLDALRTRAVARHHYRVADGRSDRAFVAIIARLAPGRDADVKTAFITAILDAAQQQLATESDALGIAWSIELQEIDPTSRINRNEIRARMDPGR